MKPLLTVAIACKNEEPHIGACIESAIRACGFAGEDGHEIILVDSYSTDDTVSAASQYDITIYRLGQDWPHSCAAGRFAAVNRADSEFIYFLDGDMTLHEDFLEKAIAFMRENPQAAGARGCLLDIFPYLIEKTVKRTGLAGENAPARPTRLEAITGGGLFRLDAIRQAGNFHPFLGAEEDHDLCQRLSRRGGELWSLPFEAVTHHGRSAEYWQEVGRRTRGILYRGMGAKLANSFKNGFFLADLKRFSRYLLFASATAAAPIFVVASFIAQSLRPMAAYVALELLLFALAVANKRGNFREGFRTFATLKIIGFCILLGFIRGLPPAGRYPTDLEVVKRSSRYPKDNAD